jgi:hypothetical protein
MSKKSGFFFILKNKFKKVFALIILIFYKIYSKFYRSLLKEAFTNSHYNTRFKSSIFEIYIDNNFYYVNKINKLSNYRSLLYGLYSILSIYDKKKTTIDLIPINKKLIGHILIPIKVKIDGSYLAEYIHGYSIEELTDLKVLKKMEVEEKKIAESAIKNFLRVLDSIDFKENIVGDWYSQNLIVCVNREKIINIDWEGFLMHPSFTYGENLILKDKLKTILKHIW